VPLRPTTSLKNLGLFPEDYWDIAPYTMPIKPLTCPKDLWYCRMQNCCPPSFVFLGTNAVVNSGRSTALKCHLFCIRQYST
jgi:hypothetical protein